MEKSGVYFVLIDGFDELFAEIHHKTKGSLLLKINYQNLNKIKILSIFTEDRGNLAEKSSYISGDLEKFKKHKNESDISDMIRELRDIDDGNIPEPILKILLKIDEAAHENAKAFHDKCENVLRHIVPSG